MGPPAAAAARSARRLINTQPQPLTAMAKRKRPRHFTTQQKAAAVAEYYASNESRYAVAKRLNIPYMSLCNWIREIDNATEPQPQPAPQPEPQSPSSTDEPTGDASIEAELDRLRDENSLLAQELLLLRLFLSRVAQEACSLIVPIQV